MQDLTAIYYTANIIPEEFAREARRLLLVALSRASHNLSLISVSRKPMNFGDNIVVDLPRHHLSIYKQALIGAEAAKTKYIALVEDDVLYHSEHFKYRPNDGKFAYNMNFWNIYTWEEEPMFTQKSGGRRNLNGLICERALFIQAIKERFLKYPNDDAKLSLWAEPGKYEAQLGVTVRETEEFYTNPPNIVFSHEKELSFENLGVRKKVGQIRATEIPYWGTANRIRRLYV